MLTHLQLRLRLVARAQGGLTLGREAVEPGAEGARCKLKGVLSHRVGVIREDALV